MSILDAETTDVPWAETPLELDAQQDYPPQTRAQEALDVLRVLVARERERQQASWPDVATQLEDFVPVLAEEAGEVVKAVNDFRQGKGSIFDVVRESVQVMAVIEKWITNVEILREAAHAVMEEEG